MHEAHATTIAKPTRPVYAELDESSQQINYGYSPHAPHFKAAAVRAETPTILGTPELQDGMNLVLRLAFHVVWHPVTGQQLRVWTPRGVNPTQDLSEQNLAYGTMAMCLSAETVDDMKNLIAQWELEQQIAQQHNNIPEGTQGDHETP